MPTQITAATHQDSISGSPEKRIDVDAAGRLWVAVVDTNRLRFLYSTDAGATWSPSGVSDLTFGSGSDTAVPSFYIDADGYAHVSFVRWQASPQTIIYARGTPRTGGGWSWKKLTISPTGGRAAVDSDVVAFRTGTGWTAWVSWCLGNAGGIRVSKIDISASGSLSLGTLVHGPSGGDAPWQSGSLEFAHTGDGRTQSASPHVFLVTCSVTNSSPVYAHRALWESGGTWTWETPVQLDTGVTNPRTVLCSVYDGSLLMAAWSPGDGTVLASEWDGVGSPTARNPPALPGGLGQVLGVSLSVDPATKDVYLAAYGKDVGDVYVCLFDRSETSWGSWTLVATRAANNQDGDVQLVRHPPRDGVDMVFAVGNTPSITVWHTRIAALTRSPSAPELLYPAAGAKLDLASGETFRWDYAETGPGDSQQSWQLRRDDGVSGVEYWDAAIQSWSSTAGFSDAFSSQDTVNWNGWGAQSAVSAGRLQITPTTGYPHIVRSSAQSLIGSNITVEAVQTPNVGNGGTEMLMFFEVSANNRVQIMWTNGGADLVFRELVAGTPDDTSITYNATDHRWWRIREASGTVYWETSPDGSAWTTRRSKAPALTLSSGLPYLSAGYGGTEPSPGLALFDNYSQGGQPVWNPSTALLPEQAVFPAGKWATGTTYSWSVRTKSSAGEESPWALDRTVTATIAPVVTITAPSGIVYGTATPTVSWTYVSATPQRDYEIRILDPAAGTIDPNDPTPAIWTSGQVTSSAARSARVADALPDPAGTYRVYLRVHDADNVPSTWVSSDFSLSAQPPPGPSLAAVDRQSFWTGVSRARLTLTGRSNYLSSAQATSEIGWENEANATLAAVVEDPLVAQTLAGMSLTSVTAGDMSAITEAGDPPEAPYGEAALTGPLDFPVLAGLTYTAIASFKAEGLDPRACRVAVYWYSADDGGVDAGGVSAGGAPGEVIPGSAVPGGGETTWTDAGTLLATTAGLQVNVDDSGYVQAVASAVAPMGAKLARMVVEVLATAAGGEVFDVARMAFAPGMSTAWTPGGAADNQTVRIERGVGGVWTPLVGSVKTDYWQRAVYEDRTMPMGVPVQYRAYLEVASDTSGSVQTSEASPVAECVVPCPVWAIRDPDEDLAEVLAYVTEYDRADESGATVTYVAGREHAVVDTEVVRAGGGSVTLHVRRPHLDSTLDVLRRTSPLVMQSPIGEVRHIQVLGRDYEAQYWQDRKIVVDYVDTEGT